MYKFQGAGNDFVILDRRGSSDASLTVDQVKVLCERRYGIGSDGVMVLKDSDRYDFAMDFYNPDGSGGMMCGNGGRCMVAFASLMGIESFRFEAPDGVHEAEIIARDGRTLTVRLKMINVSEVKILSPSEYFLNTGTRHYVRFVKGLKTYDVAWQGSLARHDNRFAPIGANANFVEACKDGGAIGVRTYEKGVEAETFACGTGIVASAIASYLQGIPAKDLGGGRVGFDVHALRDLLAVDFIPGNDGTFSEVYLTGPATFVAEIETELI